MKIFLYTIMFFLIVGFAGFIFVAQMDLDIPAQTVEQRIDNERFFNTATN